LADIEVTVDDKIAVVRLNRPAERNAMTLAMWQEMARLFGKLGADPDVRVIILTGTGGNFSVGADVSEFGTVRSNVEESAAYEAAVFPTLDEQAAMKEAITKNWDSVVGANVQ